MHIYISEWLRKYPEVYESLCTAFEKSGVNWHFLDHTAEVWAKNISQIKWMPWREKARISAISPAIFSFTTPNKNRARIQKLSGTSAGLLIDS